MKSIFTKLKQVDFEQSFSQDEHCLEYLADEKWQNGYVCRKCGNTNYCQGKTPFSRRCTRCKTDESATAHTIFHRCKIPLNEAFKIAYLVCGKPEISTYDLSKTLDKRQMTCWKFKKKITECLEKKGSFNVLEG